MSVDKKTERNILELASKLNKECLESSEPDPDLCLDLLNALKKEDISKMMQEIPKVESSFLKAIRSFHRHRRTALTSQEKKQVEKWDDLIHSANDLMDKLKAIPAMVDEKPKADLKNKSKPSKQFSASEMGPPNTVEEFRERFITQNKESFKDPPTLPPAFVTIDDSNCPLPERNKETGDLTFVANDSETKKLLKDFHPNLTPEEVLRGGAFGGTYFRPIISAVMNKQYSSKEVLKDTVPKDWIKGLPMNMLTSKVYHEDINKYGALYDEPLSIWESNGWISPIDPYGWWQWYCRFYQGRRCSDDARQITRWIECAGPKSPFRTEVCDKILEIGTTYDDKSVCPVVRQGLFQWALDITQHVLDNHSKQKGK